MARHGRAPRQRIAPGIGGLLGVGELLGMEELLGVGELDMGEHQGL